MLEHDFHVSISFALSPLGTDNTPSGWAVGNMIAPQIFQTSDAPRYIKGFIAHLVIYGVYLLILVATRLLLLRRNVLKRRAAGAVSGTSNEDVVSHELAFQDLTDRENPNFRYVY